MKRFKTKRQSEGEGVRGSRVIAEGVTDLNPRHVRSVHSLSDSYSHAITCSQVSVHKLLLG